MPKTGVLPRVALVSSSFAPYIGGVETHVDRVAGELVELGHEIEVWTVDRGEGLGVVEGEGWRTRYLPTPLPARTAAALGSFAVRAPRALGAWTRAYREFDPSVLHIQCFGPNGLYSLALARRFGVPYLLTSHGETLADDHSAFAGSALLRAGLTSGIAGASAVTAPSEFVLSDLRANYGLAGGTVVPNGVDLPARPSVVPAAGERPYLLGVGRLGRNKGFDLLVEAFARAEFTAEIDLVIVGDGPEREALEARVAELGVSGRVRLVGALAPPAVAATMAGSVAVVVPSRVEAFGIVALEAWREGAPLIMTDRGGAPEFIRDGDDGLLVDPTDLTALTSAMERVVADEPLRARLARAGARRVSEYTWMRVARDYSAFYARAFT